MEMSTVKLGDIADFSNGVNFDKSAYRKGIKLIGVADFKDYTTPVIPSLNEVDSHVVRPNDLLKADDIVFVRSNGNKDLVGRCMIIPRNSESLTYSGFCIRCRFKSTSEFYPKYFLYLFKSPKFRKLLSNTSVGANIQNLSQGRLNRTEVEIPSYEIQCKIASILSSYDDMIDNCKKQIALLEEAAQRLYREWFVNMHYPGYQDTQVGNNGLPIGWIKSPILDVYNIAYGKTLPTSKISPFGKYPVYGSSKCIGYYDKNTVDDFKVLITSRGNAGRVHRTYHKKSFVTNNSFVVTPHPEFDHIPFSYIFYSFIGLELTRIVNGSAQQQLTNAMLDNVTIIVPPKNIVEQFGAICNPYIDQINPLHSKIEKITYCRDLLLPRLISGEIKIDA